MNPDAVDRIVAYRLGIRQVRNLIVFFCVCVILCEDLVTMMCCYKVLINLHEFQNIFFYIKDNITLPKTVPNYLFISKSLKLIYAFFTMTGDILK